MIIRKLYLDRLLAFVRQPIIKVITGMRRAGKSTLLTMLAEQLLQDGVRQEQVIRMNFESMMFDDVHDYRQLYRRVQEKIGIQKQVYLLLDEVQQVEHWEKAINSLFVEGVADIYITGSNAKLLSSEISTLLAGRYVEIQMLPLSFREYMDFLPEGEKDRDAAFAQYLRYGGLPAIPGLPQQDETIELFLSGIYHTVLLKDVVERSAVRDPALLSHMLRFLADNIGSPVSSSRISGYLTSHGRKASAYTIDNYLHTLESAFIFYRAPRYDIKGKLYLKTQEKYYIVDNGIRNALLGFRDGDYGHILENIVYLELLRRGYTVGVGRIGRMEVDFVAQRTDRKQYFQVAATALEEATRERELRALAAIPDQYEKTLLTMDKSYIKDFNGIRNVNILDFLLDDL